MAVVPATDYSFQMIGGLPVVMAPTEIDATTSGELRAILLQWQSRGHTTVVVDMTGTAFCDCAGFRELVLAHRRGAADGGGLRLVSPAGSTLLRAIAAAGLDGVIPHFASSKQALAEVPATAIRRLRRGTAWESAAAPASSPPQVRESGWLADSRSCEQCGAAFVPAREHARFCTSDCRDAWNRDHLGDPVMLESAFTWSMSAMSEAAARLHVVQARDKLQAFEAIGEAVWWTTMVDATLVRHYPRAYDTVMAAHTPAKRRLVSETLTGLRFVRNWISRAAGLGELIETGTGTERITGWTWKPVPQPALAWLPPRAQAWEQARHRAYVARLAGQSTGNTFGQAVAFLSITGAEAASGTDTGEHAGGK